MKTLMSAALLALAFATFAQEKVDTAMMKKIQREAFTHSQVEHLAHYLTEVAGARLTNSPGYRRASRYAVETFKKWGLSNSTLESYGEYGKGWELEKFYIAVTSPHYQQLVAYPHAYSGSTNGLIKAEVIIVDPQDSLFIRNNGNTLKNKIVILASRDTVVHTLLFKPSAKRYTDSALAVINDKYMLTKKEIDFYIGIIKREAKVKSEIQNAGALAIVKQAYGSDGTAFVDGLYEHKKNIMPGLPEVSLAPEEFQKLRRLMRTGKVELELELKTKFYTDDLNGYNVIAEIPGTDPTLKGEVVMLGAHLDSWHTAGGATDNGAGCVMMMEAMRILKALNVKPRRTIRVALWGGEEQGLLGSVGYIKKHFGDPATMQLKPEHARISGYFNLDNGTGKIRGVYTQGNELVKPIFQKWLEPFAALGATTVTTAVTGGTDHQSFDGIGIPGFQFIQDPIEYNTRTHHTNMDTYDHLIFDDLRQASAIVAAFVYNAAMRNDKLPRKPSPKPGEWILDLDLSGR
jgi:carboxypeptidase Q